MASITVTGRRFEDWGPGIQKAMDAAFKEHLLDSQKRLMEDNPKDTARMASSWRIAKGQPDASVEPERDGPGAVVSKPPSEEITHDGTWYISNSLPYAERVCHDPLYAKGGAGGPDWYTRIANSRAADLNKRSENHLRRI